MAEKGGDTIVIKKKKGGGHAAAHGGAWKVAFADFMTAMMAFFLVMWLMGSDEETKAAIEHYFNNPSSPWKADDTLGKSIEIFPLGNKNGTGDSMMKGLNGQWPEDLITRPNPTNRNPLAEGIRISRMVEDLLDGKVYGLDISEHKIKFSLPENILFKAGSADLTEQARVDLDVLGQLLKSFKGYITIKGYSKEENLSGTRYKNNWELSLARSLNVMNFFIQRHGMDEKHLLPVAAGSGFNTPGRTLASADPNKSRRVEFTMTYDVPEE